MCKTLIALLKAIIATGSTDHKLWVLPLISGAISWYSIATLYVSIRNYFIENSFFHSFSTQNTILLLKNCKKTCKELLNPQYDGKITLKKLGNNDPNVYDHFSSFNIDESMKEQLDSWVLESEESCKNIHTATRTLMANVNKICVNTVY